MRTSGAGAREEHVAYLAALRLKKRRIKLGRSRAKIEAKNNRRRKRGVGKRLSAEGGKGR